MTPETMDRIFDPFFTTKEMGRVSNWRTFAPSRPFSPHRPTAIAWMRVGTGFRFRHCQRARKHHRRRLATRTWNHLYASLSGHRSDPDRASADEKDHHAGKRGGPFGGRRGHGSGSCFTPAGKARIRDPSGRRRARRPLISSGIKRPKSI